MNNIHESMQEMANELAKKHIKIIEENCKDICKAYGCRPDQLILQFKTNTEIDIRIHAMNFSIENIFTVNGIQINK